VFLALGGLFLCIIIDNPGAPASVADAREHRRLLMQLLGGLFGAIALLSTWVKMVLDRKQSQEASRQANLLRAIDLLRTENPGDRKTVAWTSGLLLLELTANSPRERRLAVSILCEQIRILSRDLEQKADNERETDGDLKNPELWSDEFRVPFEARQLVLSVLGRLRSREDPTDLQGIYLESADLSSGKWARTRFDHSNLIAARLGPGSSSAATTANQQSGALSHLAANLPAVGFQECSFREADLRGARCQGANFSGANFEKANLRSLQAVGAKFTQANLFGADLSNADLSGVDLSNSDCTSVTFSGTVLANAITNGAKNLVVPEPLGPAPFHPPPEPMTSAQLLETS
jgi:uncharacterized protein YjbI with pentapeptide repeats